MAAQVQQAPLATAAQVDMAVALLPQPSQPPAPTQQARHAPQLQPQLGMAVRVGSGMVPQVAQEM